MVVATLAVAMPAYHTRLLDMHVAGFYN